MKHVNACNALSNVTKQNLLIQRFYHFVVQIKICCCSQYFCCLPGKCSSEEKVSGLESQLEKYEWQLKILDEVLAASGNEERDQLLKDHQHGDLCMLVHTITEMVKLF